VDNSYLFSLLVYPGALLAGWIPYALVRRARSRRSEVVLAESRRDGLMEPASLYPLIDKSECLGCTSCVDACPEANVLGLVDGKAALTRPANCIGHGACRDACPFGAITLVLGTEKRGVDIPLLGSDFQTNVPGIFVAGELGGMGLIRNAIEQGRQAMESIHGLVQDGHDCDYDVVIVGAGAAGFSASLAAQERGLRYVGLERETLGGTVAHYPRGKIVMTAPAYLPLHGRVDLRETTKEALLGLWTRVARETGVRIQYGETVTSVAPTPPGFEVETANGRYRARAVLLSIGRRGTPRKLGVPGEDCDKVVYRLIEPEQYAGQDVLVVGGGDSALVAALSLAEAPDTRVALSYRGEAFSRAKPKNRQRIEEAEAAGGMHVFLGSEVLEIGEKTVKLRCEDEVLGLPNDAVLVCAGGVLPTPFLRSIGIEIETKRGAA
jgi:thioredoxin reductase (NADPH)